MDLGLRCKVALVTGSSRGIGLATAKAFAAEGCRVMLSARSAAQLRETEEALRATGAEVAAHAADVGTPDDAARLIQGGADLRRRAVGAGVCALWHPDQHGLAGLDSGRRQRMGSLPPRQPRVFRGLRPSRFSDGPPRHRRGGGGCDRIHRLAARPLDQRPKYPGGWSGAAARAARPPALLGLVTLRLGPSQEMTMPGDLLSGALIEVAPGTQGSNPVRSCGESANHRFLSRGRAGCR